MNVLNKLQLDALNDLNGLWQEDFYIRQERVRELELDMMDLAFKMDIKLMEINDLENDLAYTRSVLLSMRECDGDQICIDDLEAQIMRMEKDLMKLNLDCEKLPRKYCRMDMELQVLKTGTKVVEGFLILVKEVIGSKMN